MGHALLRACRVLAFAGLMLSAAPILAEPVARLQIEQGSHHAAIRAVASDAGGRTLLTAGEDKTARLWHPDSGTLLATFRPPAGEGNTGKLYAAAMAPDATIFALAGWSAGNDIYLVDRQRNEIVHRITGLPNIVTQLAFSPDGRMLAVGLWGSHGLRLFITDKHWRSAREASGDPVYDADVNGLAWAPKGGRLVTSSNDGLLRAYEVGNDGARLLRSQAPADLGIPHGIAYSPDGTQIAVGSGNLAVAGILDADTLRLHRSLTPPAGRSGRNLSVVAWLGQGEALLAGGTWAGNDDRFPLCRWPADRTGEVSCQGVSRDSITALSRLPDGSVAWVSAAPALGIIAADSKPRFAMLAGATDFRQGRSRFRLAPDGSAIGFPAGQTGGEQGFDLLEGQWRPVPKTWQAPRTTAGNSSVTNWFERRQPQINGRALTLDTNEWSLSAAVAAKGERIALATSQAIRLYDRNGQLLWKSPVPATPWQVSISDDGRWVVAGFGDGTIRWLAAASGAERLALLPHADHRRWVVWTPEGHYAASPGGEDLFGWQVERGAAQAADFFPAARFRKDFYRPAAIAAVFDRAGSASPAPTVSIVASLPPTLRILSPENGDKLDTAHIRLLVKSAPDAPTTALKARINGQPAPLPPLGDLKVVDSSKPDELVFEVKLPLAAGENRLLFFAENRHGVSTESALTLTGPTVSAPPATADYRPALYVLAIGISAYRDAGIRLEFAAKDSRDLSNYLKRQEGGLYRKVDMRLLTDDKATRDDVLDGLEWIRRESTTRDIALVFLAGHGINDADGTYYFLPQDVDAKRLKRTAVIFTEIRNTLTSLPGKALFFVDTCHAGNVLGTGTRGIRNDTTAVINELASAENGVIVFAAATGRQYAQESTEWGNGAFTKAILEGLGGKADYANSGRITHKMLDLYISERVKQLTEGAQSPVTIVPNGVPDFPLVLGRR